MCSATANALPQSLRLGTKSVRAAVGLTSLTLKGVNSPLALLRPELNDSTLGETLGSITNKLEAQHIRGEMVAHAYLVKKRPIVHFDG